MITFLISGLWHGANWTFVIWGGVNGLLLVMEHSIGINQFQAKSWRIFGNAYTFIVICFTWVFFRATSVDQALTYLANIFFPNQDTKELFWKSIPGSVHSLYYSLVLIAGLYLFEKYQSQVPHKTWHWAYHFILAVSIIIFGVFKQEQFIYFQF